MSQNQLLFCTRLHDVIVCLWLGARVSSLLFWRHSQRVSSRDICLLLAGIPQSPFCPVTDWTTNKRLSHVAGCWRLTQITPETV